MVVIGANTNVLQSVVFIGRHVHKEIFSFLPIQLPNQKVFGKIIGKKDSPILTQDKATIRHAVTSSLFLHFCYELLDSDILRQVRDYNNTVIINVVRFHPLLVVTKPFQSNKKNGPVPVPVLVEQQ